MFILLHENAVHGDWSNWSNWTECSATCGVGARSRERHCDNPRLAYGGRTCEGIHKDKKSCSTGEVCVGRCIIKPCPYDMMNAISVADIAFIMPSSQAIVN